MAEPVIQPVRGLPVSGRPWKDVQTHRSAALSKKPRPNLQRIRADKAKLKIVKELEAEIKAERNYERKTRNEKKRLKAEQKKEATIRQAVRTQGAQYIETKRVKKMDLKARRQLMKVPPELLQNLLKKRQNA